jgi:hypothetical protein
MINEAVMLQTMALSKVWVKILESQEDARKVQDSFKRIDEHTKNFQVRVVINEPMTILMQSSTARNFAEH